RIPLNDDKREKANRLQNRQALHETQMNQIRAAATPQRRRLTLGADGSPHTPNDENMPRVGGSAVTPMKRVPILANFEEWMKMATDNKINAANSWNFALIDYFHDMSLLKEGDGVNFQRASCTLDGCVKIYTSRVDSVATETGKLLSGLASSKDSKRKGEEGEGDGEVGEDDEEEGEDGQKRPKKKRAQRSAESTLVSSFAQLQLKKMELEFAVDPLFKKASADFDEGGAKGLLLNHLAIDTRGRIVFDSSDDAGDARPEDKTEADEENNDTPEDEPQEADIDISSLGAKFFPDLASLDHQDICPSLKNFDLGDPNGAANLPFLKAPDDWRDQKIDEPEGDDKTAIFGDDNPLAFDDDDDMDGDLGDFDLPANTGFGEGGEVWAKEAALETQMRVHTLNPDGEGEDGEVGEFEADNTKYGVSLTSGREADQENILQYFDQALSKNWAGPEHWRIRRIKDSAKPDAGPTKRKEKAPFEIDFAAPMTQSLADVLYTSASSASTISLPKKDWKSKTRNLLPDDKHFNSRQLLRLFLKPKARLGSRKQTPGAAQQSSNDNKNEADMDEVFWARENAASTDAAQNPDVDGDDAPAAGNYDADFFADDGLGAPGGMEDDDTEAFADAREAFSPGAEGVARGPDGAGIDGMVDGTMAEGAFGANIVAQSRRMRPEYVQYARVAKKVDVRRLKEEMWRGIGMGEGDDEALPAQTPSKPKSAPPVPRGPDGVLKFTDVVNNLQSVYPKQAMADISTSYCFICLLHLANEKGLVIENEENFTDLTIRKDYQAEIVGEGD
ncbi:barren, partial [Saccharata proteae CBS 121410]